MSDTSDDEENPVLGGGLGFLCGPCKSVRKVTGYAGLFYDFEERCFQIECQCCVGGGFYEKRERYEIPNVVQYFCRDCFPYLCYCSNCRRKRCYVKMKRLCLACYFGRHHLADTRHRYRNLEAG